MHKRYDEQVEQAVKNYAILREDVPESKIRETIKKHRSFEQGKADMLELYSEEHFTDAEFIQLMDAMEMVKAGKEPGAALRPAAEKLAKLMQTRFTDESWKEKARRCMKPFLRIWIAELAIRDNLARLLAGNPQH
ncbi:hypothetical protein ACX3YG_18770 [Pseudomonas wadenswilerensis]